IPLNRGARVTPLESGTIHEVREIDLGLVHRRDAKLGPAIGTGFHNAVALRKVLQAFRQGLSSVERLGDSPGIHTRKLEKGVSAYRKNRGPHLCRILVKKLIRRDDTHAKLAGLGENGFDAAPIGNKVLDLIAVEGEERALLAGEERILH